MPIKSIETQLESRGTLGNLPRWGKLRKGAAKPDGKIGPDLDYFRLTLETPYAHLMEAFVAKYTDKPKEFSNVYLAAGSADSAFEYWYEHRAHARIVNRCDGDTVVLSWNDSQAGYDHTPHACTCNPNKRICKHRGRLDIVLPEFCREVDEWGKLTIETGSYYDCVALRSSMMLARDFASSMPDVAFWSIPFRVGRSIRTVPVTIDGKRSNKPMSLLYASTEKQFNRAVFSPMVVAPTQMLLADQTTGELPEIFSEQDADWDRDYVNEQTLHLFEDSGSGAENHQANAIDKMIADGSLTDDMTDDQVIDAIQAERLQRASERAKKRADKVRSQNAPKPPVEGSNSRAADDPVFPDLDWVHDVKRVAKFIGKAKKELNLEHGGAINALRWADDYTIENVADFHGTPLTAWAACVVMYCDYDSEKVADYITDPESPVRIEAERLINTKDIPF